MYDAFSSDYDRFVNWENRLAGELPFIEQLLQGLGAQGAPLRVLDAACGTGMHAIALAKRGYQVAGADLSEKMIERARENTESAGVNIQFEPAGFGALTATFGKGEFDAVVCLGNSLPHLLALPDLVAALEDFATCLRPGGLLLIQNRNFDAVLANQERWMEPQSHREGEQEWVFLRFYDFQPDGLVNFNIVTLTRGSEENWAQRVSSTLLYPLREDETRRALGQAGFSLLALYGSLAGAPFTAQTSGNLVVAAYRG
jgi:glycine/sarcosine N-methyltransferase